MFRTPFLPGLCRQIKRTLYTLALAGCLAFGASAVAHADEVALPELGDASSGTVSPEVEKRLGQMWLQMFRRQVETDDDPLLTDYLEHLVYELATHSELKQAPSNIVVVENKTLNAFAVPGGVVGIHNGLMLAARHEDELASVIAHELAHLSQRHFARGVEEAKRNSVPSMLALLGAIVIAATAGGDAGMAAITSTQAAFQQQQLRFSRAHEQEADRLGMKTLVDAGYDAEGMPRMFERMLESTRYRRRPPEFLLSHPVTESRVSDSRNRAREYPVQGLVDSPMFGMMRARVTLHYQESPAKAVKYFRNQIEEEGGSVPATRYGLVLALIQNNQFEEARLELDQLMYYTPQSIPLAVASAEIEMGRGRPDLAAESLGRHLKLSPGNHPLTMSYARALTRSGRFLEAESVLVDHSRARPSDPSVWYELAEVHGLAGHIVDVHRARSEYFILIGALDYAERQLGYALDLSKGDFHTTVSIEARLADIVKMREEIDI